MAARSTIMDANSFRSEHADRLDMATRKLTDRRDELLGGVLSTLLPHPGAPGPG